MDLLHYFWCRLWVIWYLHGVRDTSSSRFNVLMLIVYSVGRTRFAPTTMKSEPLSLQV